MKIAILYICTGQYSRFFPAFYVSAKQHLLQGIADIHYFVFTDDEKIKDSCDVHIIRRECQGFPYDTLYRFEMFNSIKDQLNSFDYIYFINSNAELIADVGEEILPDSTGITAIRWPKQKPCSLSFFYPYERNKRSTAYMPPLDGPYTYFMGGFYGGTQTAFLNMSEQLAEAIRTDVQNGIIACRNDESYLNKYLHLHKCKELPKGYCCPEEWISTPSHSRIIFRNKVILDTYFNKGRDNSLSGKAQKAIVVIWNAIRWYIHV